MGCLGGLGVDGADPVAADGDDRIQAVLEAAGEQALLEAAGEQALLEEAVLEAAGEQALLEAAGEQALLEAAGEQAVVEAGRVAGLQAVIVAAEHLHRDHASC